MTNHPSLKAIKHIWKNGAIVSAENMGGDKQLINLRIQAPDEEMLCDIELGEQEAISVAHAILGVVIDRLEGDE